MTNISTAEIANYLELVLDTYFDAMNYPYSEDFALEKHLELLNQAKNFVVGWKKSDLPRYEMNEGFRNPLVRVMILSGVPLSEDDVSRYHQEWEDLCSPKGLPRI